MFYIYKIENLCNGKSYIGCSNNAEKRFKQHINLLNKNKHKNPKLQNAWNKYGEKQFTFYIVTECETEEEMLSIEIKLIEECPDCYNIAEGGTGGNTIKNYTEHQRKELSKKKSEMVRNYQSVYGTLHNNPFLNKTEEERYEMIKVWSECKKGSKNGRAIYFNKVVQIKEGVIIKVWDNVYEASEDGTFNRKYIINCANNKPSFNSHKGFEWKWYNE